MKERKNGCPWLKKERRTNGSNMFNNERKEKKNAFKWQRKKEIKINDSNRFMKERKQMFLVC